MFNLFAYASRSDFYCGDRHATLAMTCFFCHSEPLAKPPWAGRPLFGTLCVPPLPLQRESILPEGWFSAERNGLPLYGSGEEKATDGQAEFGGAVDRITRSAAYRIAVIGEKQRGVFD